MAEPEDALRLLRAAEDAVAAISPNDLLDWVSKALRATDHIHEGLLLAGALPRDGLAKLVPELVELAVEEKFHERACDLLTRLPFDSGAELIVPEVLRVLRRPSSDYWVVWMLARLLHHLGYHEALRHVVVMTQESTDTDWQMAGEWIERDLLTITSSES